MKFLEKDLEEIIYEYYNYDSFELIERGLNIDGNLKRQLKIGNYGIADIVSFRKKYTYEFNPMPRNKKGKVFFREDIYSYLDITVYELKKDKVGISTFLQAVNYAKGIKDYLTYRGFNDFKLNIVLIGGSIDDSGSFCFLPSVFNDIKIYTYRYEIDGLHFKLEDGYILKEKGFNNE